jgi:Protein of unknown function (DUF1565)
MRTLAILSLFAGCSGSMAVVSIDAPAPDASSDAGAGLDAGACPYTYVVSVNRGRPGNPGTCESPFDTLGAAYAVAKPGDSIHFEPGLIDEIRGGGIGGIVVPDGIALIGDEANKGLGAEPTAIDGGGDGPIVTLGAGATLAGFVVDSVGGGPPAVVVQISKDGATLRNNRLVGGTVGVQVMAGASRVRIEGNIISGNQDGVVALAAIDLGGGPTGSAGGNTIACNSDVDLKVDGDLTVDAKDDAWDGGATPSRGCSGGADICISGGASVVIDGATAAPACH